jgi:AAHS family 4-hydroxybenzoate transporter-like MFS transporter
MWLVESAFPLNVVWRRVAMFCAGFCISGGQKTVIALGIGRLGGIA